ncbi:MAG: hypothetical protein KKG59_01675 [Nanoarchaeota archaeon]|nr:hypothetical protein [Nanoarchaeota archaeon]
MGRRNRNTIKGQASIEFMFLLGFMFVVFIIFFVVIQDKTVDLNDRKDRIALREVNNLIKNEVRTANYFEDGYIREFWIPRLINGKTYDITVSDDGYEVYLEISGIEYIDFLDNETAGSLDLGTNTICKKEGKVRFNDECLGVLFTPT